MKPFRKSTLVSLLALSTAALAGFVLPACSAEADAVPEDEESVDNLTVANVPQDTFLTNVLGKSKCTVVVKGKKITARTGSVCPTTLAQVLDVLEGKGATAAAPAPTGSGSAAPAPSGATVTPPNVFVVSELADKPSLENGYRFVLSGGAGVAPEKLYLASFTSGRGAPQDGVEIIAWSEPIKAFVYWKSNAGKWERKGDGTQIPAQAKGAAPAFECASCHTSGGPIMKELHDSWANWTSTWLTVTDPKSPDATFNRMFSKVKRADDMEIHIIASEHLHVKGRIDRAKAEGKLKGIATQLFCDVGEGTLIAAHSKNSQRFGAVQGFSSMLPGAFVVSPLFRAPRTGTGTELGLEDNLGMSLPTIDGLSIDSKGYSDALAKNAQKISGQPGDAIFPMNGPEKSYADIDAVQELLRQKLVDKDFVADVLMTDFTTPAFSDIRCGLAESLPDTWTSPDDLKTKLAANLSRSGARGAKGLAARLAKPTDLADHTKTLEAYGKACADRKTANAADFTGDQVKMLSQRRVEFVKTYHQLVESDALIPTDNLGSRSNANRFNGTTCVIEAATAKFVGED